MTDFECPLNVWLRFLRGWLDSSGPLTAGSIGIFTWIRSTCLFHWRSSSNCTRKGQICSSKIPDSHFGFSWKFTTQTAYSMWNNISSRFLSVDLLVSSILVVTLADKSGYIRSTRDRGWRPINSIAGDWTVVDCGDIRYRAKTRNNWVFRSPGTF